MLTLRDNELVLNAEPTLDQQLAPLDQAVGEPRQVRDAVEVQRSVPLALQHPPVCAEITPVAEAGDERAPSAVRFGFVGSEGERERERKEHRHLVSQYVSMPAMSRCVSVICFQSAHPGQTRHLLHRTVMSSPWLSQVSQKRFEHSNGDLFSHLFVMLPTVAFKEMLNRSPGTGPSLPRARAFHSLLLVAAPSGRPALARPRGLACGGHWPYHASRCHQGRTALGLSRPTG